MRKHIYQITILIVVALFLFIHNYVPHTFLSGWDNLLPEFNLTLNIKRSLFAVWQEYQGLGLLGGMGHAADLPRQIILGLFSLVLPTSIMRYAWTFLMLLSGPIGAYFLIYSILNRGYVQKNEKYIKNASLVGGLFYLLNLATLQTFFVPYDAFVTNYGIFPWLIWSTINFLENISRRNLIILLLISTLGMTYAYIPTLFLVYIMVIFFVGIYKFIELGRDRQVLKNLGLVFATILIINSFWLLPFTYFTFTQSNTVVNSKINTMATEDVFLRNKQYGTILDTLLLKNFWFNATEFYPRLGKRVKMLAGWDNYISTIPIQIAGAIISIYIISGFILCLKEKKLRVWGLLGFIGFIFIASDTPPFSWLIILMRDSIPLLSQFFRFPFTKWNIELLTTFSLFLGIAVFNLLTRAEKKKISSKYIFGLIVGLIFIYNLPFFTDYVVSTAIKVNIPNKYFELFNYFKEKPIGRIAVLPQQTFWDWKYYGWGEFGSGFMWYGIEQPIADRAFDNWSNNNQNYYWELSNAIYSDNQKLFEDVLEKYQINWLVVDNNIISPSTSKELYFDKIHEMFNHSKNISLVSAFGNINVYKVNLNTIPKDFVFLGKDLPTVGPTYSWNNFDKAYEEYGNYISVASNQRSAVNKKITDNGQLSTDNLQSDVYYPFRSLFTGRKQSELEFGIVDKGNYFSFTAKIPKSLEGSSLLIPPIVTDEISEVDANNLDNTVEKYPQVFLNGEFLTSLQNPQQEISLTGIKNGNLEIRVPKIEGYYSYNFKAQMSNVKPKNCDQFNQGVYKHDIVDNLLRLTSVGSSNCLDFDLPNLTQRSGYLVTVESRNVEGKSLLFALINKNSSRADTETYLPKKPITNNQETITSYFVIPPMEQFGVGYSLHLDNISIGRDETINDLGKISVHPIPYQFLTSIKVVKNNNILWGAQDDKSIKLNVDHPNPSYYQISLNRVGPLNMQLEGSSIGSDPLGDATVVLSQSYDNGWKAYEIANDSLLLDSWYMKLLIPLFGKEIKSHVEVNNWENGWKFQMSEAGSLKPDKNITIVIIYLPQYLEYLGFGMMGGLVLYLLLTRKDNSAADKRLANRQATFTGPTPPGTGV